MKLVQSPTAKSTDETSLALDTIHRAQMEQSYKDKTL